MQTVQEKRSRLIKLVEERADSIFYNLITYNDQVDLESAIDDMDVILKAVGSTKTVRGMVDEW